MGRAWGRKPDMEAQGALSPQPLLEDGGVIAPSQMRTRAPCPTPTSLSLRVEGRARGREGARSACGTVCWEGCGRRAPTSSDGSPPPRGVHVTPDFLALHPHGTFPVSPSGGVPLS